MFSRTCLGQCVPWISGFLALLAGIFFLVEGTAGVGAIKVENLPLSISFARNGKEQLYTRWVHWKVCHELSYPKNSCTLKIFCWDRERTETGCGDALAGPFAAGIFSCIAGICLLPLPLGYMNAASKTHVIWLVSISGAAWLFGLISFSIVAAEHARYGSEWEDKISELLPDVSFERNWGGGLFLLLVAWIFSSLVFIPTSLWLVFYTPPEPSKVARAADRMWQNVRLAGPPTAGMYQGPYQGPYQEPQRQAAPLNYPAHNQPYGSQPVSGGSHPMSQGQWTAAAPKPNAPAATTYGGPAALRTSHKMPNALGGVQVQGGPWGNSTE